MRTSTSTPAVGRAEHRAPAPVSSGATPARRAPSDAVDVQREDVSGVLGAVAIVLALLALVILPAITTTTVVHVLGGAAALVALAALASLAHLVVSDVLTTRAAPRGDFIEPRQEGA